MEIELSNRKKIKLSQVKLNLARMKMYLSRVNKLTLMKLILSNVNLYIYIYYFIALL